MILNYLISCDLRGLERCGTKYALRTLVCSLTEARLTYAKGAEALRILYDPMLSGAEPDPPIMLTSQDKDDPSNPRDPPRFEHGLGQEH